MVELRLQRVGRDGGMYSSGNRTWRGGYPSWRLMVHWWFKKTMGEYAIWAGVGVEVSVIIGLEIGQMNLNHFTGTFCSPLTVADFLKQAPKGLVDIGKSKSWKGWLD